MDIRNDLTTRSKKFISFIFIENYQVVFCLLVIAVAVILAYRNAFGTPFIFDDLTQILQNNKIQSLHWPWAFLENNRRPVLYASLAFDFHRYGFNAYGYHQFNIRVHVLNGLMFFLLTRKTLLLPSMKERFVQKANLLALSAAVLWVLHPVNTQAVTYIIQRAESLMAFFFLTAMYCASQYFSRKKILWLAAAAIVSLLSGLTKEVALALPLMVLFYDRTFFSESFRAALKDHWKMYLALILTWVVMIMLYLTTSPERKLTAGFGMAGMTPFLYAVNQPAVIVHYIGLALWPGKLIFDYYWPPSTQWGALVPCILLVLSWLGVLIAAYRKFPAVSFLMLSFLLILLPSSSIIPLKDLIFEYRLYLSLSCLSILFVLALYFYLERFISPRKRMAVFVAVITSLALILGGLTFQRNKIYATEEAVWHDVIRKQPFNARAFNNLGEYLMRNSRDREAKDYFLQSAALNNTYPDVFVNLSTVLGREGKPQEAIKYGLQAVAIDPDFAIAHNNVGSALSQMGRYAEAVPYFQRTLDLGFVQEGVFLNLGVALDNSGKSKQAIKVLEQALELNPQSTEVRSVLEELRSKIPMK